MPSGLFYNNYVDGFIYNIRSVWLVFIVTMFYSNSFALNANSVDPDQTPQNAASDLGLHYLPMSLL